MAQSCPSLAKYFVVLRDPRVCGRCSHRLIDLIVIAICAVICGADDWQQIEIFAKRRRSWLEGFLPLPNGVPSHDTFERIFDRINPATFIACFTRWTQALCRDLGLPQIAIDGKTLRGSGGTTSSLGPALHLVSAWATNSHLTLGQVAVDEKSNEITAIPKLLELLDVHGALVTIDSMGCQKKIAKQIVDNGGDYILAVKNNQSNLLEDIQNRFVNAFDCDFANMKYDTYETEERSHGRDEKRSYTVLYDLQGIRNVDAWAGLCVIGICHSERIVDGKQSDEVRYFIGSREASAEVYGVALRNHWRIENCLHWQLDVSFSEDASKIEKRNAAENFAALRRIALMLLKRHPSKRSIAGKRYEATLDTEVLEQVLNAFKNE